MEEKMDLLLKNGLVVTENECKCNLTEYLTKRTF